MIEYQSVRKEKAKQLGVLLSELDKAVKQAKRESQPKESEDEGSGRDAEDFMLSDKKKRIGNEHNTLLAFSKMGVTLSYSDFSHEIFIDGYPGYGPVMTDGAFNGLWLELQRDFHFRTPREDLTAILEVEAQRCRFHPVLDYLDALKWDGVARLSEWLPTYFGAENTALNRAIGRLTLIAAVRRVRQPGCKFDTMLVLEGPQGTGKSRGVRALCPDERWFSDSVTLKMSTKEVMELTAAKWLVEIGELAGMGKGELDHIKSMLSRQTGESRMSYGRYKAEYPRQLIFIGTTNESNYLIDETGNRRYFPVKVGKIDIEGLKRDRDQLWAEAAHYEAEGEAIFISDAKLEKAAKEAQRDREIHDEWEGDLAEWLNEKFPEAADELARMTNGRPQETTITDASEELQRRGRRVNLDAATQKRIARCLKRCGWQWTRKSNGKSYWGRT